MFSKKALKYMRSTIENIDFWRSGCLHWNRATGKVEIRSSRIRWFLWFFNMLLHFIHVICMFCRYIQFNYIEESAKASVKIYTEYAMVAYMIPLMLTLSMYFRLHELVSYINEYIKFYGSMQERLGVEVMVGKECNQLLTLTMRSGQLICWVNLIVMFRKPARPVLLTSLLPNPERLKPWDILPFAGPHILVWWTMWSLMHLYAIHLVTYISGTVATTNALRDLAGQGIQRDAKQRFMKTYRGMQILLQKFHAAIGPPLAGHKVLFVMLIVRSMYGALTQSGGEVRILQALVGSSAWLYLQMAFKIIGSINEGCEDMLTAWKPLGRDLWFGRFLKSCRKLRVSVAGLYFVDKEMCLTLAAIILENTVNMMIAEEN